MGKLRAEPPAVVGGAERSSAVKPDIRTNISGGVRPEISDIIATQSRNFSFSFLAFQFACALIRLPSDPFHHRKTPFL